MGLTSEIEVLNADLAEHGLVDFIARNQVRIVDEGYDALLANLATILNNKGASSFTDEFGDSLEKLPGPRFFLVQHVFCDLIPRLELDHLPILHLVDKLVRQGVLTSLLVSRMLLYATGARLTRDALLRSTPTREAVVRWRSDI